MMGSTFAFDSFTRSRTPTELRRRVETLCHSMEKELAKPLKREREKRQRAEDAHEVGPPSTTLPMAALNFDAMLPSEVRDHGHLVLTPLILTQPSGLQGTAAECGQTGLGMEEAEAMDMERD